MNFANQQIKKMSPISQEAARMLTGVLEQALASQQRQEMRLAAIEGALKKHVPAVYQEYRDQLEDREKDDDAMKNALAIERLRSLLAGSSS